MSKSLYITLTVAIFLAMVFGGHEVMFRLHLPWWGWDIGRFLTFLAGGMFAIISGLNWRRMADKGRKPILRKFPGGSMFLSADRTRMSFLTADREVDIRFRGNWPR